MFNDYYQHNREQNVKIYFIHGYEAASWVNVRYVQHCCALDK
jgi:hypothetical protein